MFALNRQNARDAPILTVDLSVQPLDDLYMGITAQSFRPVSTNRIFRALAYLELRVLNPAQPEVHLRHGTRGSGSVRLPNSPKRSATPGSTGPRTQQQTCADFGLPLSSSPQIKLRRLCFDVKRGTLRPGYIMLPVRLLPGVQW